MLVNAEGVLTPCSDEAFVTVQFELNHLFVGETQPHCRTQPEVCALLKSSPALCEKRVQPVGKTHR